MCTNKKKPSKPFLTYEEQLERVRDHYHLDIIDKDKSLKLLKSLSYYDIVNGYKDCFMKDEVYKKGISIINILIFSTLDKNVQNILFKYSVHVENTFKTRLSYVIAKDFGVEEKEYLDKTKYASSRLKKSTFFQISKTLAQKKPDNPLKHYIDNHNHIPPWILLKSVTFSNSTNLHAMLPEIQKKQVLKEYYEHSDIDTNYDEKAQLFINMIIIVRKFRNKIAHNYKFVGEVIDKAQINRKDAIDHLKYNLYKSEDLKEKFGFGRKDVYSMIVSLINLLGDDFFAPELIRELLSIFKGGNGSEHIKLYFEQNGFPLDFLDRLEILLPTEKA